MKIGVLAVKGSADHTLIAYSLAKFQAEKEEVHLYEFDVVYPKLLTLFPWEGEVIYRRLPQINREKCTLARKCIEACNFRILKEESGRLIHRSAICRGCGMCREVCPSRAISWREVPAGEIGSVHQENITLFGGRLADQQAWEGFLIRQLKEKYPLKGDAAVLKAPLGLGALSLRAIKEAEVFILVSEPYPALEEEISTFGQILQGFGVPGVLLLRTEDVPSSLEKIVQSWGVKIWAIPQVQIEKGKAIYEVFPTSRKILESIWSLGAA